MSSKSVLELVHMDLIGPSRVESLAGKKYILVAIDDFSRLTWVQFLKEKSDTIVAFKVLCLWLQNDWGCKIGNIVRIRSIMNFIIFAMNMVSSMNFLL